MSPLWHKTDVSSTSELVHGYPKPEKGNAGGERANSDITAENYSKATNLADVWIYTKGFNENIRDDIKNMRGVKDLTLAASLNSKEEKVR